MPAPKRILLVEDDPEQTQLYLLLLQGAGYVVTTVADGEAALAQLALDEPDLLLTDWYLPSMSGDALIRETRRRFPTVRTILMSTHAHVTDTGQRCGADDCLQKGDIRRLRAKVAAMLA